jgi:coenzyme Q-binding protein COQ10
MRIIPHRISYRTFFTKPITFTQTKVIGYTPTQIFQVVSEIDHYKEFVPFCLDSKVIQNQGRFLRAKLRVGVGPFVEEYISQVQLTPHSTVIAQSKGGIFKDLRNEWRFTPLYSSDQQWKGTKLDFLVKFEFSSLVYQTASDRFLRNHARSMVDAFERRARQLYGPPTNNT